MWARQWRALKSFKEKAAFELALKHRPNSEMWRSGRRLFLKGRSGSGGTSMSKGRMLRTVGGF